MTMSNVTAVEHGRRKGGDSPCVSSKISFFVWNIGVRKSISELTPHVINLASLPEKKLSRNLLEWTNLQPELFCEISTEL